MPDPFDTLDSVYGQPRRKRQSLSALPDLDSAEESSILADLGAGAISGLSYVGQTLDKITGSRALRGVLGGKPRELLSMIPFSDAIGDFTENNLGVRLGTNREDIVHGTDLIGAPKDTPLFSPEGMAGFALEVGLDPTLPFTGFLKGSATAAGKGLKAAGMFDDAIRVGTKAAAKTGKKIGPRVSGLNMTTRKYLDALEPAARQTAETKLGTLTDDVLDAPLTGTLGFGIPFMDTMGTIGKAGGIGETVAKVQDKIGDVLRWGEIGTGARTGLRYSPGRHLAQLFDSRTMGLGTETGQRRAMELSAEFPKVREQAQNSVYQGLQELKKAGVADDAIEDVWRQVEGIDPLRPEYAPTVERARAAMQKTGREARAIGAGSKTDLEDEIIKNYWPRFAEGILGQRPSKILGAGDPSQLGRANPLKDIEGGTGMVEQMLKDPNLSLGKDYVEQMYGAALPFHDSKRIGKLTNKLVGMQEAVNKSGADEFFQHPLASLQTHMLSRGEATAKGSTGLNIIADTLGPHVPHGQAVPDGFVRVRDILPEFGLRSGNLDEGAAKALANKSGTAWNMTEAQLRAAPIKVSDKVRLKRAIFSSVADRVIPKEVAADVMKLKSMFEQPEEVSKLVGAMDSAMGLFKFGVLTWPARYARDFMSGQFNLVLAKMWSASDLGDAKALVNGKQIDALQFPVVREMLAKEGMAATPENAMQMLRTHIASMEIAGAKQAAVSEVGQNVGPMAAKLADMEKEIPGMHPVSMVTAAKELGGDWRKLGIKGVFGAKDTTAPLARAGNELGTYTDSVNRLTGYLNQIRRGIDPFEARAKVMANQVDYTTRAFTPFERTYMKRIAPFYSFTKGMMPYVFKGLADEPSGRLAQVVRGQGRMREDEEFVPSHIAQGTAMPIPGGPEGFQRYLTSLGLMHEDPLNMFRPGQTAYKTGQGTLQELAGRLNPLAKMPLEWAAGKQLFSGRDLEDLEGNLGRIGANLTGADEAYDTPIIAEQLLANSPASRLATTVRTLTDTRKGLGSKAVNLLSGVRTTDVDIQKSRNIAIREAAEDVLKGNRGVKQLRPHLYVKEEDRHKLSDADLRVLQLYKTLASQAQKKARERKKATPK